VAQTLETDPIGGPEWGEGLFSAQISLHPLNRIKPKIMGKAAICRNRAWDEKGRFVDNLHE